MSAKSDAIETAVTDYIQARTALDAAPGVQARVLADRAFARLAALVAPRIRYFTRSYGLAGLVAEKALVHAQLRVNDAAERLRECDRHIVRRALTDIVRHTAPSKLH
jgi:RNA polymerase sigma-32 factor